MFTSETAESAPSVPVRMVKVRSSVRQPNGDPDRDLPAISKPPGRRPPKTTTIATIESEIRPVSSVFGANRLVEAIFPSCLTKLNSKLFLLLKAVTRTDHRTWRWSRKIWTVR